MRWINEPLHWTENGEGLAVRTALETDFWNNTFYDFLHDNGHFYHDEVSGDFTMSVTFKADYTALYDQAGLMVRVDGKNWIKAGIEYTDGELHFSTVVTRDDQSDWSMLSLPNAFRDGLNIRVTRHGTALRVQLQAETGQWRMARLAYLAMPQVVQAGMMCCSPTRAGLDVQFNNFRIGEPIEKRLHDD
ncbi:DUF1349 domain-containing protein [Devosia sp. 2618]|uniref:DUF1349 domain-containing protein n=1 Tax=Devosia sp. 2618 TaxID=3156454 RepID=UPI00339AB7E4